MRVVSVVIYLIIMTWHVSCIRVMVRLGLFVLLFRLTVCLAILFTRVSSQELPVDGVCIVKCVFLRMSLTIGGHVTLRTVNVNTII